MHDPVDSPPHDLLASIPVRSPEAYAAEFDDGSVLYRDAELHRLDRIGALLWGLFDGSRSLEDVSVGVAAAFGEDPQRCARDVGAFAEQLADAHLIRLVPPAGRG